MVYSHNEILISNKKNEYVDGSLKHYTKEKTLHNTIYCMIP